MNRSDWAVGLMTGTIIDGFIDIAAVRTDGRDIAEFGPWSLSPYPDSLQELIAKAFDAALAWRFDGAEPGIFAEAEEALTLAQADAVVRFLDEHGIARNTVRVVVNQGQTVMHPSTKHDRTGNHRHTGNGQLMDERHYKK